MGANAIGLSCHASDHGFGGDSGGGPTMGRHGISELEDSSELVWSYHMKVLAVQPSWNFVLHG